MKITKILLSAYVCALPLFVSAQSVGELQPYNDITLGEVVEGESLPIGVSLGESFGEIEQTFDAIDEFDLNERFCSGLRCFYTARDAQGEVLGEVSVLFRYNSDEGVFRATSMNYDFKDWVTTRGLSLRALREDISSQEALLDIYPEGLAVFRDRNGRKSVALSARRVGIRMVSNESPTTDTLRGTISTVR